MSADPTLDWLHTQYSAARPLGDDYCILVPLTFGRWRVSRATAYDVLDGY